MTLNHSVNEHPKDKRPDNTISQNIYRRREIQQMPVKREASPDKRCYNKRDNALTAGVLVGFIFQKICLL
jgi:hypothetical protein